MAWAALDRWKKQKEFDLVVEVFANSRRAMGIIRQLRSNELDTLSIDDEILLKREKYNEDPPTNDELKQMMVQTVFIENHDYINYLYELHEKIWASFDEEHVFHRFYKYIMMIIEEIDVISHENAGISLIDRKLTEDEIERYHMNITLLIGKIGDRFDLKIKSLFSELNKERQKYKHSS